MLKMAKRGSWRCFVSSESSKEARDEISWVQKPEEAWFQVFKFKRIKRGSWRSFLCLKRSKKDSSKDFDFWYYKTEPSYFRAKNHCQRPPNLPTAIHPTENFQIQRRDTQMLCDTMKHTQKILFNRLNLFNKLFYYDFISFHFNFTQSVNKSHTVYKMLFRFFFLFVQIHASVLCFVLQVQTNARTTKTVFCNQKAWKNDMYEDGNNNNKKCSDCIYFIVREPIHEEGKTEML